MSNPNEEKQEVEDVQAQDEQKEATKDIKAEEQKASETEDSAKRKTGYAKNKKFSGKKSAQKDQQKIQQPEAPEFMEKVISINRITKVTKGGKKLSFSALVVVGDTKGKVGYSLSKASEVSIAIRKAMANAKKNMMRVNMKGSTITHEIIGECSGAEVLLKPASEGTGVIAAGPVRAVCDGAGIHNILTKCHRSNNPINVVKATMDGLSRLKAVNISDADSDDKNKVEKDAVTSA